MNPCVLQTHVHHTQFYKVLLRLCAFQHEGTTSEYVWISPKKTVVTEAQNKQPST